MQGWFVIDFSQNTQRLKQSLFWKRLLLFVGNNVKERISKKLWLQQKKDRKILSDYNGTQTHSHLVCKQTLNHLAKLANLAKWLIARLRTK